MTTEQSNLTDEQARKAHNKKVRAILRDKCHFDSVSEKNGVWTVRRGFFYRHGGSAERLVEVLVKAFEGTGLVFGMDDMGEVWKPFRGGASVASQSHWWVKFTVYA